MGVSEKIHHYRGDLRSTALPEMLAVIHQIRVSGVVEATYGEFSKRIFLESGYVVHASSSDLADSLGSFLRSSGRLSDGQFHAAMQKRAEGERRLGEVLVEQGVMSPGQVYEAIKEHIENIIWSLFSWEEGTVTFQLGEPDLTGVVRIQIPLRQVILQGIKRAANARSLVQRMGGREAMFEPHYRFEDLIEIALEDHEYRLLAQVDGKRTLYELCTHGGHAAADNARLLYAFFVLGLIRRADVQSEKPISGGIKIRLRSET
jgi:two-component system, OmpR family, response regulator